MPLYVTLPPNLCKELKHEGKSVYYGDYCTRHKMKKPSHVKRPSASLVTQNSVNNLIMTDHYSTLPLGYSHKDYDDTLDMIHTKQLQLNKTSEGEKAVSTKTIDEKLLDKVPNALEQIETAWAEEVDATKRDRGLIYGNTGKRMDIHSKNKNTDAIHSGSHPGFGRWINTANEYEKEVVHKFVTALSEKPKQINPESTRPRSTESLPQSTEKIKKVRIHSPPKSAPPLLSSRSSQKQPKLLCSPPPPGSASKQDTDQFSPPGSATKHDTWAAHGRAYSDNGSRLSSASSSESFSGLPGYKNVSTQLPYHPNEHASSPLYNTTHRRAMSSPASSFKHSCQNCEACKKKLATRMLREMSLSNPKSCDEIKREMSRYPKTVSTYMYGPEEDYIHAGTSFQNVNRFKRGYFIIHPDFVSEHPANLRLKRRMDKKYFGESKVAAQDGRW